MVKLAHGDVTAEVVPERGALVSSVRVRGQSGVGSSPEGTHTSARTRPGGGANAVSGFPFNAVRMKSCQIGPAPSTPEMVCISALLALPIHAAATSEGGKAAGGTDDLLGE